MHSVSIGITKEQLDTPALCVDLDAMESNIERMAGFMREHQVDWRPHQKCHKNPAIAHRQLAAGAIGVTCAKVSEAEVMIRGGIFDVLIANMIVGQQKVDRLASLCRWGNPVVACDHFVQAEQLSQACQRIGVKCRAIVEVDIGLHRVGTQPGVPTLQLAQAIDQLPGLELVGLMGYEGHLLAVEDQEQKKQQITEAMSTLVGCRDQLLESGLCCDIVSAGGTGSYQLTTLCEGITEMQAGGGIFADPLYQQMMHVTGLQSALTLLATVVSRPARDRAVIDCGRKSLNSDLQMPVLKDVEGATPERFSAEHGQLHLDEGGRDLKIGDKIELFVGYADLTTILHDHLFGFRNDKLEAVWPIQGRGCLQ